MKKLLSLLLAMMMLFGLCACNKKAETPTNPEAPFIGEWTYTDEKGSEYTYHFKRGGYGYHVNGGLPSEFLWEVKDGALIAKNMGSGTLFLDYFELENGSLMKDNCGNPEGPYVKTN